MMERTCIFKQNALTFFSSSEKHLQIVVSKNFSMKCPILVLLLLEEFQGFIFRPICYIRNVIQHGCKNKEFIWQAVLGKK